MILPLDIQLVAALPRLPPAVSHHGNPREQTVELGAAPNQEGFTNPLDRQGRVQVCAGHTGPKHRGLFKGGVEHARYDHIDTKQGLAAYNGGGVHLGLGLTNDLVRLRVLEHDRLRVRCRQGRGLGRQGSIGC